MHSIPRIISLKEYIFIYFLFDLKTLFIVFIYCSIHKRIPWILKKTKDFIIFYIFVILKIIQAVSLLFVVYVWGGGGYYVSTVWWPLAP